MDNNNIENTNNTQPSYQQVSNPQPVYQQPAGDLEKPVSIGKWVGTLLLSMIPCVNIILLIVWACSDNHKSRKNWAIATFIVMAIMIVLSYLLVTIFGAALHNWLYSFYGIY